jgi:hypothetical protein
MTERNNLIKSIPGVSTIYGYNDLILDGKYPDKPLIPRSLIIIDEYQFLLMSEKCVNVLEDIARKGRSVGMSLMLISQDVPTDTAFSRIKQLLDHRFAFNGTSENVDRLISGMGKRVNELELQKGLCFYQVSNGNVVTMRSAFAGDDLDLYKNIDIVVNKYPGEYRPMKIVGKPEPLIINDVASIPMAPQGQLINDYRDKGICHIPLGKFNLTERLVEYNADESNPLLVIVGDYVKSKTIATSVVNSMFRILKNYDEKFGKIYCADLCETRLLRYDNPLKEISDKKDELENNGDFVLDAINFYDYEAFGAMVETLYEEYTLRCNSDANRDPIQVVILSLDTYQSSYTIRVKTGQKTVVEVLSEIMANSRKCDIYFTIQLETLTSMFAKSLFGSRSAIQLKDLIILSDSLENTDSNGTSLSREVSEASSSVGRNASKDFINALENSSLNSSHSIIISEGNISKFSHYQYSKGWIDSLIKELKK